MVDPDLPREPKANPRRSASKKGAPATQPATTASTKAKTPGLIIATPKPAVSACDDLKALIAKRAYELYVERGYRHGCAMEDWLDAEREILSQVPPV